MRAIAIKGGWLRRIERCAGPETLDEVGVGNGRFPEGHGIGSARADRLSRGLHGEAFISNLNAAKRLLERWPERRLIIRFAGTDEGDLAFSKLTSGVVKHRGNIGIPHVVGIAARC